MPLDSPRHKTINLYLKQPENISSRGDIFLTTSYSLYFSHHYTITNLDYNDGPLCRLTFTKLTDLSLLAYFLSINLPIECFSPFIYFVYITKLSSNGDRPFISYYIKKLFCARAMLPSGQVVVNDNNSCRPTATYTCRFYSSL